MTKRNLYVLFIYIFIFSLVFSACGKDAPGGNKKKKYGKYSSIVVKGNIIYTAYYHNSKRDLMFARSLDRGSTWRVTTVDSKGFVGTYTSMAVDGEEVFIAYHDISNQSLKLARSRDGGATWKAKDVQTLDSDGKTGMFSSIAISNNHIFISYARMTKNRLKCAVSSDRGKTWIKHLVDDTAVSLGGRHTSIAAKGSHVYISYNGAYHGRKMGKSLKFAKSIDWGKTWKASDIKIIDGPECSLGLFTSMVVNENSIFISYTTKTKLKLAVSFNGGTTWRRENIKTIESSSKKKLFRCTSLVMNKDCLFVVYISGKNLKAAKSLDGGKIWSSDNIRTITQVPASEKTDRAVRMQRISLAASGINLFVSYYDSEKGTVAIVRSKDDGINWKKLNGFFLPLNKD